MNWLLPITAALGNVKNLRKNFSKPCLNPVLPRSQGAKPLDLRRVAAVCVIRRGWTPRLFCERPHWTKFNSLRILNFTSRNNQRRIGCANRRLFRKYKKLKSVRLEAENKRSAFEIFCVAKKTPKGRDGRSPRVNLSLGLLPEEQRYIGYADCRHFRKRKKCPRAFASTSL